MRLAFTLLLALSLPAAAQCDARKWRTLLGTRSAYPATATSVDDALSKPGFADRFASFVNSRFNPEPGRDHGADASLKIEIREDCRSFVCRSRPEDSTRIYWSEKA